MMNTKMTVAERFALVSAFLTENGADEELIAFIADRAEKATRKSGSSKPHVPTDEQNALRQEIIRVLSVNGFPMSIKEMQEASEILAPLSTSKISGNITPMLRNGKNPNPNGVVHRMVEKKVAKFYLATDEEVAE